MDGLTLYSGEFTETFDPATGQTIYGPPETVVWSGGGRLVQVSTADKFQEEGWSTEEVAVLLLPWDLLVDSGQHANFTSSRDPLLVGSWWEVRTVHRDSLTVRRRCDVVPVKVDITVP